MAKAMVNCYNLPEEEVSQSMLAYGIVDKRRLAREGVERKSVTRDSIGKEVNITSVIRTRVEKIIASMTEAEQTAAQKAKVDQNALTYGMIDKRRLARGNAAANMSVDEGSKNSYPTASSEKNSVSVSAKKNSTPTTKQSATPIIKNKVTLTAGKKPMLRPSTQALLEKSLCEVIAKRTLTVCTRGFCACAKISPPTFYAHYRNLDELRTACEQKIIQDVALALSKQPVPQSASLKTRFDLFLTHLYRHRYHFFACADAQDYFLLSRLMELVLPHETTANLSPRTRIFYITNLQASVSTWITYDHCEKSRIPKYAARMASIVPERVGF